MLKRITILAICLLGMGSDHANAAIWYVDDSAPAGGTGTSWTSPFNTLQAALTAAAASGDEIRLGRGTYKPAGPGGSRSATFTINKSVTIKGGYCGYNDPFNSPDSVCGSAASTVLSGDLNGDDGPDFANNTENSLRVVTTAGTITVILQNLQISAGNSSSGSTTGGGMFVGIGTTLNAINVWFTDNHAASFGGAVDHRGTNTSTYARCVFYRNRSGQWGGAVSLSNGAGARMANCRFHSNTLTAATTNTGGGALWINGPSTIVGCVFTGNSVVANGGLGGGAVGVGASAGTSSMINCSLASNTVTPDSFTVARGVGSYASSGFSVTNCVFANTAFFLDEYEILGNTTATYNYRSGEIGTGNINDEEIYFVDLDGPDNITGTPDDELVLFAGYYGGTGVDVANAAALPADFADLDNDANTAEPWPTAISGQSGTSTRFAQHGLIADGPVAGTPPLDMGAFERVGTFDVVGSVIYVDATGSNESNESAGSSWARAINRIDLAVVLANRFPSTVTEVRIAGGRYDCNFAFDVGRPNLAIRGGFAGRNSASPDFRDPNAFPTIFDGDVLGNDPPTLTDPNLPAYSDNRGVNISVSSAGIGTVFDGLRFHRNFNNNSLFELYSPNIVFRSVVIRDSYVGFTPILQNDNALTLTMSNCDFEGNASFYAPAVYVRGSTLRAVNCRFTRGTLLSNSFEPMVPGRNGGTVLLENNASASFTNCLFNANTSGHGGAIHANGAASLTLNNCTLTGNSAVFSGGAIYCVGGATGLPQINNSILWGNTAPANPQMLYSGTPGSTTFSNSVIQGGVLLGTSIRTTDPLFADANGTDNIAGNSDDDFRLRGNSPAIDLGSVILLPLDVADLDGDSNTTEVLPRDLDLLARDFDGDFSGIPSPDAGCYEFAATGVINLSTNTIWSNIAEAIANASAGHTVIAPSSQFSSEPFIDFANKPITIAGYSSLTQPSGGRYTLTDGAILGRPTGSSGPSITLNGELRVPTNASAFVNAASLTNNFALNVFDNSALTAGVPGSISGAGNIRLYAGSTLSTTGAISSTGAVNALPASTLSTTGALSLGGTATLQSATVLSGGTTSITAVTNWTGSSISAPTLSIASTGRFTGSGSVYASTLNSGRIYTVGNTLFVGSLTNNVGGIITVQLGTATLIGSLTNNGTINGVLSNPPLPPPDADGDTIAFYREFYGEPETSRTAPGDGMFIRGDYVAGTAAVLSLPNPVWRLTVAGSYDAAINSNANYDMRQAELVMAKPDTGTTTIEAMSLDRGNVAAGLDRTLASSFPIGTLRIGAGAAVSTADARDNANNGQSACEAVYCDKLIIESGAVLSAPSCKVYYRTLTNSGGTIANPTNVVRIPPPCGGADFNGDGVVNTPDLTFFLGRFGQVATPGSLAERADFNADGVVTTPDLTFFLGRFGSVCP
ncbi:MAG: GC-type dockerin domain-anchored protein [Phycisphaerales bacterium]